MDHSFAGDRHEIIGQCRRASPEDCLGYQPWGNIVLKIDSYRAVKFGPSVSKDEAENQAAISMLVNHEILRVPKVYDWFQDAEGWGYIVMEFMAGERASIWAKTSTNQNSWKLSSIYTL